MYCENRCFNFSSLNAWELDHWAIFMFNCLRNCWTIFQDVSGHLQSARDPPSLPARSELLAFFKAVPIGVWWYFVVILIYSFLMINAEHLFMYLFAIYVSSLVTCLFKFLPFLKWGCLLFLTKFWGFSVYSGYKSFIKYILQIFSPYLLFVFPFSYKNFSKSKSF